MSTADKMGSIVSENAFELSAKHKAMLRAKECAELDLIEAGGGFTLSEVQRLMNGISRQAIDRRVREMSLFAVNRPNNKRFYPALQFQSDGQPVNGLKEVIKALPSQNPWYILNFLVNENHLLSDRKPIDVLKNEGSKTVVEAASRQLGMGN